MGNSREDSYNFMIISLRILLRMGNISEKMFRENENRHFILNTFFVENLPFVR
jgi:hypothetical protein